MQKMRFGSEIEGYEQEEEGELSEDDYWWL